MSPTEIVPALQAFEHSLVIADGWILTKLEDYDKWYAKRQPYVRPTHDLICSCRKCEVSPTTYWRRMKS